MKKKTIALLLALALVFGGAVGGTIAWLTAETAPVVNTFTVGDIDITLIEHAYSGEDTSKLTATVSNSNNYPLIPGTTYAKDPTVTVEANSEDCYLFVKFEEINDPSAYLEYTSALTEANGWHLLVGENDVWWITLENIEEDWTFHLLTNDQVKVKDTIVKAGTVTTETDNVAMPAADKQPVLKYTAYAVQCDNLELPDAWAKVKPTT